MLGRSVHAKYFYKYFLCIFASLFLPLFYFAWTKFSQSAISGILGKTHGMLCMNWEDSHIKAVQD